MEKTKIKSYTDIKQSKRLSRILSSDSADLCYIREQWNDEITGHRKEGWSEYPTWNVENDDEDIIVKPIILPCWSLASLIDVISYCKIDKEMAGSYIMYGCDSIINGSHLRVTYFDNPVDACVAMIERSHKDNLV